MSTQNYTTRRLNSASGAGIKNTNGCYTRVKIHKENRTVLKVRETLWTDEAHARYAELYPNDICNKKVGKNLVRKKSSADGRHSVPIVQGGGKRRLLHLLQRTTQGYHNTGMWSQLLY